MTRTFKTFKTYPNVKEAKEVKRFLNENNVTSLLRDNFDCLDNINIGQNTYELQVKASHFDTAVKLLEERCEKMAEQVEGGHYLCSYTNSKLYDILITKDEREVFEYKLAKKIAS